MISDDSLKYIANVFIGDEGDYYSYKSGPDLVRFFNDFMNTSDEYSQGFPSRWFYVITKFHSLIESNRFNSFLTTILSPTFIMSDSNCVEVEAIEKKNEILAVIKRHVHSEGYSITGKTGGYRLVKRDQDLVRIGEGGYAIVFKQKSTGLVVKKLKEDYIGNKSVRSRFRREFHITKSLEDLNCIINVDEFDDDSCSYTMEEAEITLEQYVTENELTEETKTTIVRMILNIMKEVHNRNVIHRDLSPNNIFINHGQIVLADFGLGKDLNVFTSHQTMLTNAVGQYRYCAPEQFMLLKDGDKRSDVYSLGHIINFVMTGSPTNTSHQFRIVAEKATSYDSVYRYSDAGQMLHYFEKTIAFKEMENKTNHVTDMISRKKFDGIVEAFIYEQSGEEICRWLISKKQGYEEALRTFMSIDDNHSLHIIQFVEKNYKSICRSFESYDPIASFAYNVIKEDNSYLTKDIAARILRYIARDINRFYAQDLISNLIEEGIEPTIEDILRN